MNVSWKLLWAPAFLLGTLIVFDRPVSAQDVGTLNSEINSAAGRMGGATGSPAAAEQLIAELDHAENTFAKVSGSAKADRGALASAYSRLEGMLSSVYNAWKQKKEDCTNQIQNGGAECDYDQPEQLSLKALYPLSWLRYQGAVSIYSNQPEQAKKLLNAAVDGFTESTLVIVAPELIRENVLGRAFCERELGKYDKAEFAKALADFDAIMKDGSATNQYKPALQGECQTFAAMGEMGKAAECTNKVAAAGGGSAGEKRGMGMLRLQNLFKAEAAAPDPAKRAEYHKEVVDLMRGKETDAQEWAVILASVSANVPNPVAEFGNSQDPFEQFLLANVLYNKKQYPDAAKYFMAAARSGKYPKAYRFAADAFYGLKRFDLTEQLLNELASQPNNPDAQWARWMKFKLAYEQWSQSGGKNQQAFQQWMAAAQDYLKAYPRGQYAWEPRFRVAEQEKANKQWAQAAQDFAQVSGNPQFEFESRFRVAECYYAMLKTAADAEAEASKKNGQKAAAPQINREQIKKAMVDALDATIKTEPNVEKTSGPAFRANFRALRGQAIFMMVKTLQSDQPVDYARIATLTTDYETYYPMMKDKFNEIAELRIKAQDQTGRYADLERFMHSLVERTRGNTQYVDFMKVLGLDFWKSAQVKRVKGDQTGYAADARLTAITYNWFEDLVRTNKIPAKNLTGTLSILGQAYIAMNDVNDAEQVFNQVVKADPGSPDANAGLARIAQAKKDYRNAIELWTRVESVAAESDDVWYEAKYNVAAIYAAQGNIGGACSKLAVTRSEHPNLGTPEMKTQWDALQRKLCLNKS